MCQVKLDRKKEWSQQCTLSRLSQRARHPTRIHRGTAGCKNNFSSVCLSVEKNTSIFPAAPASMNQTQSPHVWQPQPTPIFQHLDSRQSTQW